MIIKNNVLVKKIWNSIKVIIIVKYIIIIYIKNNVCLLLI